jgi:ATP-dependent Clp protease ATP-binding subunit ClpX
VKKCSFCGKDYTDDVTVLSGQSNTNAYICEFCVSNIYKYVVKENEERVKRNDAERKLLTPKELKQVLDEFVIGQDRAKKVFSVGVYNHYKRIFKQDVKDDDTEISKSNILLIGPTGSGKTLMAQTLAKFLDVPIAICDATSLTEAGYVGEDVENILTRLLQAADGDLEKCKQGIVFIDEIDKISRMSENRSITRDVSGEGVQQALLKIIEGSIVNISPKGGRKHPNQDFIQIDSTNILFVCGGAFDGLEEIIKRRVGKNILGFNQKKVGKSKESELLNLLEPEDLIHYGLIPELIGRLHVNAVLQNLNKSDMVKVLTEPKNSIVKQYEKLFAIDEVKLSFETEALEAIAELAIKRKTGARGLRTIMEELMTDIMFELPDFKGYEIVITLDVVKNGQKPLFIKKNKKSA